MGRRAGVVLVVVIAVGIALSLARGQGQQPPSAPDTVQDAQTPREAPAARPEQRKSDHDRSTVFSEPGPSSNSVLERFTSEPPRGPIKTFTLRRHQG